MNVRQSFTWWSFAGRGLDTDGLLSGAARIGYAAVELIPQELWSRARHFGLQISAMNGHASIEEGLNRRVHHERIVRELETNVRMAADQGIPNLICFSGNRAGQPDGEGASITAEVLRRISPIAEHAGITLVLELLNSRVDHPDYQCDHLQWGLDVTKAVNSPAVKLLYDIYHAQVMDGNLIHSIRAHHASIGHYHTAGCPGRHELDDTQEIQYPPVLRAIAATGYDGYLAHEFVPTGETLQALRAAYLLTEQAVSTGDDGREDGVKNVL